MKAIAYALAGLFLIALTSAVWTCQNSRLRHQVKAQADIISDYKTRMAAKYYEVNAIRKERNMWVSEAHRKGGHK